MFYNPWANVRILCALAFLGFVASWVLVTAALLILGAFGIEALWLLIFIPVGTVAVTWWGAIDGQFSGR